MENLALDMDHGINGAIHHVTIDRYQTALTLAEEIRVHTTERELDLVGYHASISCRCRRGHLPDLANAARLWLLPNQGVPGRGSGAHADAGLPFRLLV